MSTTAASASVPLRHPAAPRSVPGLRILTSLLGHGAPSTTDWSSMGAALLIGDDPMDQLVEWMTDAGLAGTRPLFDQALRHGIGSLAYPPDPLRDFFFQVEATPEWVDHEKLCRGARAFRTGGIDGVYLARDVAFLGGYLASGFNRTLIETGALEQGPAKRFAETLQWALDVTSEAGLSLHGLGYQSTLRVRFIHSIVRRHVSTLPDWSTEQWGLPINQTDMAATLVGALMTPFVTGIAMGIMPAGEDLDAVAHLVRYVGWLIGVRDEWLPEGFADGVRILYQTLAAIMNPDATSSRLALPMADDPLSWHFHRFRAARSKIARAQHLSIAGTFLGGKAMYRLGLPTRVLPWYPAMRLPVNLARSVTIRAFPGTADYFAARGRLAQESFLRTLVGTCDVEVGGVRG